uniref:Large ribosomal subunit protein uL5c n=1 Tax=Ahnfeltia plicata TaxID=28023 RepID=A0A1C9CBB7_9FLOR|nr:ribosomal protein L5 [Ahnfeltia plicata]AOM65678.1 ribosomal protein L5 [Ahnfeltia plicata]UAT97200.1 ribosomal protein L5 [Ahnfeltia plicata]UAT97405.1 ribosomal protein L5 [Ahnfeltia plicata]
MNNSLKILYNEKISPELLSKFEYKNIHEIPKLVKITINRGIGEASQNAKALDSSIQEFTLITGQKPIVTRAKKSIAGFKIRDHVPVGLTVTLRQHKMYDFLNKLINLSLPRIRDFRGINPKNFDGRGNYNLGLKEQLIFPEIEYDSVEKIRGMDIAIVTTAKTDEESLALLQNLGMPFHN